ncbi:AlbA family DNA-binding domain-containing protein [Haladaptatus cibarius]|uniref:AlbA family DNA-binding domain-containing protein n=1 Tax=Haladaptatus cibarius TaxID=453847 RepID=UPI000679D2E0|nr:ATP-binding protein [Haladaptatus cibarius]
MSGDEVKNNDSVTKLIGSATLFQEASNYNRFLAWSEENHDIQGLAEVLSGYRILTRSSLHVLGYSYLQQSGPIEIEKDYHFLKSLRELGNIDKVQSDCEAAALSRNINQHNRQVALATSPEELKERLDQATEELAQPLTQQLPGNIHTVSDTLDMNQAATWAAAKQCFTYLVDQRENMPWGLYSSDFDILLSNQAELDAGIRGYTLGLEFLWRRFAERLQIDDSLFDGLHQIKEWEQIDKQYYGELQNKFFQPFSERHDVELGDSPLRLTEPISKEVLAHLFADDRIPVIGKEEQLKQLLLWEHAKRLDQHSLDKGALFISIVEGIARIREQLDTDEPVFVRRFVHPDPDVDGNNFSYAVRVDHPHLLGSHGMRGWATFVRLGTDYSGYGSTQYELTEKRLEMLLSDDLVEIEEMGIPEQQFKKLLKKNHGTNLPSIEEHEQVKREPRYAGLTIEEILSGESERVEFKRQFTDPDKMAKEIAALANTNGGVVVVGVNDDGSVYGVEDTEALQLRVANLATSEKFRPPIYPNFNVVEVSGEDIMIIEIGKLDRPCAVSYRYYARVGTSVESQLFEELKQRFDY